MIIKFGVNIALSSALLSHIVSARRIYLLRGHVHSITLRIFTSLAVNGFPLEAAQLYNHHTSGAKPALVAFETDCINRSYFDRLWHEICLIKYQT